jgi:hydroxyethylthiazole kinase-like uncharacterized protein yjeF
LVDETIKAWHSAKVPLDLLDPNEMGQADRLADASLPSFVLMEAAGAAVARVAAAVLAQAGFAQAGFAQAALARAPHVQVLCGPGNNGGDGYVAARRLTEAGFSVEVLPLVEAAALKDDAARAAASWHGPISAIDETPFEADLVIDALFGAGLSRPVEGTAAAVITRLNEWAKAGGHVLAIDVPSGLDGASGQVRGVAVTAQETVTFFRLKPGHLLMPGRLQCGRITLADIGIPPAVLDTIEPRTWLNAPGLWREAYPVPRLDGHKYDRGHAVIVSGPIAQTGAARLCARGALRIGAGLVTVATTRDALPIHAAALTAIMTRVAEGPDGLKDLLADPRKNVIALGPGLGVGAATSALVAVALAATQPKRTIVLDADALTSFSETPDALFAAIRAGGHDVILTPHDGEFHRLFGKAIAADGAKPERARRAAALGGAIIVLKGPDTVVAHPDGRVAIAASEAPWLATAGSGDVLAGMIAGLAAQHMAAFSAANAAVWLHAEAARRFGPGLISEDLPDLLPPVLADLLLTEPARGALAAPADASR